MKKLEEFLQKWLIPILLTLMVISAFIAYGSPMPVIKLLKEGDPIAWRGVKVIFGWIIAGIVIVFLYNWFYDFFTQGESKIEITDNNSSAKKTEPIQKNKK